MPFIVQCPHAECRKFMLLEDATRGSMVDCLLCKKPIKVDPSASSDGSAAATMASAPPVAARPGTARPGPAAAPPVSPPPPPRPARPAPPGAAPAPTATPTKVLQCPHCKAPLRLPAGSVAAVKCPKCGKVFKV